MLKRLILFFSICASFTPMSSFGGCLIYNKAAFEGQIVDAETMEPLDGAVVVAIYKKWKFCLFDGPRTSEVGVKEELTGEDGRFYIPSYTTFIQPFSWSGHVVFTIYKPGYLGLEEEKLENFLDGKECPTTELKFKWILNRELVWGLTSPYTIELPKIKSNKNRLDAIPGRSELVENKAKMLMRYIEEEREDCFKNSREILWIL